MKKSDKMRQLLASAKKAPDKKIVLEMGQGGEVDADVNKDGKVDEKDVSLVKKMADKVKKKIVKKKD